MNLFIFLHIVYFFDVFTVCCLCSVFLSMYLLNPVGMPRIAVFGWSEPLLLLLFTVYCDTNVLHYVYLYKLNCDLIEVLKAEHLFIILTN